MPGVLLRKPHGDPARRECGMMAEADRGVVRLPAGKYQGPWPLLSAERDLGHVFLEAAMGTSLYQSVLFVFPGAGTKYLEKAA